MRAGIHTTRQGFSLVEMLVALTLSSLLLVVLLQTLLWISHRAEEQVQVLDRSAKARLVLDMLESDLQSLVPTTDPTSSWLHLQVLNHSQNTSAWVSSQREKPLEESLQFELGDEAMDRLRFGVAGMWIRFLSTCEDRSRVDEHLQIGGDVNAVAYQLIRRELSSLAKNDPNWAGYQLFRSVVRADHVFREGYQLEAYDGPSHLGYPGELNAPRLDNALCEQIADLGFRLWVRDRDGDWLEAFPWRDERLAPLKQERQFVAPQDGVPARIEIFVRVLTPRGANRLRLYEAGTISAKSWWHLVEQESQLFHRVVELPTFQL